MKRLPTKFTLHLYKKSGEENTGVSHYSSGKDYIILKFMQPTTEDKQMYLYNYEKPGKEHVENMKKLAEEGKQLSGYVNQNVRKDFYAFWNKSMQQWELNNE
jgi:hypothetical protein